MRKKSSPHFRSPWPKISRFFLFITSLWNAVVCKPHFSKWVAGGSFASSTFYFARFCFILVPWYHIEAQKHNNHLSITQTKIYRHIQCRFPSERLEEVLPSRHPVRDWVEKLGSQILFSSQWPPNSSCQVSRPSCEPYELDNLTNFVPLTKYCYCYSLFIFIVVWDKILKIMVISHESNLLT